MTSRQKEQLRQEKLTQEAKRNQQREAIKRANKRAKAERMLTPATEGTARKILVAVVVFGSLALALAAFQIYASHEAAEGIRGVLKLR